MAAWGFAPGIRHEAEVAVRPRWKLSCGEEEPFGDCLRGLGSLPLPAPSAGWDAGWTDGRTGRQRVGSAWQNGAFVLSRSRTHQGPFNELFWSGQPAETIFALTLGLMAKPASKPAAAEGGRGAAACREGGPAPPAWGQGRLDQGDGVERRGLLPWPTSPAKGTDLPLSPPFACVGFFFPSISPSGSRGGAGEVFSGRRVSPGPSPTPREPPHRRRSRSRGFVGNQTR